jgi:hypothetical protein
MPEPATPRPSTTPTRPRLSPNGTAPATPSEATKAPASKRRPATLDRFRMAMTPLRQMMRRTARRP